MEEFILVNVAPVAVFGIAFLCKSTAASWILKIGGGYFSVAFLVGWILEKDCGFGNFQFGVCQTIPQVLSNYGSGVHLFNLIIFAYAAPLFLALAVFLEVLTRRTQ